MTQAADYHRVPIGHQSLRSALHNHPIACGWLQLTSYDVDALGGVLALLAAYISEPERPEITENYPHPRSRRIDINASNSASASTNRYKALPASLSSPPDSAALLECAANPAGHQQPRELTVFTRKLIGSVAIAVLAAGMAGGAMANDTQWQKNHPRREQVNGRLANQNARIHQEVKEGEMSRGQAAKLHSEDHQIRAEERTMASHDGGHITRADQRALNQQENAVSKQIGR